MEVVLLGLSKLASRDFIEAHAAKVVHISGCHHVGLLNQLVPFRTVEFALGRVDSASIN